MYPSLQFKNNTLLALIKEPLSVILFCQRHIPYSVPIVKYNMISITVILTLAPYLSHPSARIYILIPLQWYPYPTYLQSPVQPLDS